MQSPRDKLLFPSEFGETKRNLRGGHFSTLGSFCYNCFGEDQTVEAVCWIGGVVLPPQSVWSSVVCMCKPVIMCLDRLLVRLRILLSIYSCIYRTKKTHTHMAAEDEPWPQTPSTLCIHITESVVTRDIVCL